MNIKKYEGRPKDDISRPAEELVVYDLLDSLGITYQTVCHAPAYTMEECEVVERELGTPICKNLFLCNRQQTDYYLLLIPGDKVFKTKYLSAPLGCARLSFAGAEAMESLLRIKPGSVSPMGLMNDTEQRIRFVIDRDVLSTVDLGCHPCVNSSTLRMSWEDFLNKFLPAVHHEYTIVDLPDGREDV
jgi:Ala-tRNA(Pro) deacylase